MFHQEEKLILNQENYFLSIFVALISILISALIHTVDPDVNGVQGLVELSVISSILLYSVIPFILMSIVFIAYLKFGMKKGNIFLLLGSTLLSLGLNSIMTTSTLYSFFGLMLLFAVTFIIGTTIPAYFHNKKPIN